MNSEEVDQLDLNNSCLSQAQIYYCPQAKLDTTMKVQCQALEWTQSWRNGHCPDRLFRRDLLTMIEEWRTVMATDFLAWAADPGLLEEINRRNLRSDILFDLMTMITGGSDGQGMDLTTFDWLWVTLLWLSYYHEDKNGYHDADNQHWRLSSWRRVC